MLPPSPQLCCRPTIALYCYTILSRRWLLSLAPRLHLRSLARATALSHAEGAPPATARARAAAVTQAQERTVKPLARLKVLQQTKQSEVSRPPASYYNRTIGGSSWHGNALYPELAATAQSAFAFAPDKIPRTQSYHRMTRYVL